MIPAREPGAIAGPPVRPALLADLPALAALERAAGEPFRAIGMGVIADHEPPTVGYLQGFQADGRAWVAVDESDAPVGYLLVEAHPGVAFVEQASVHPDQRGRRVGVALAQAAGEWAVRRGLEHFVVTTYRDVPWNAPYYRRMGFRDIPDGELPEWLRAVRRRERALGLDAWPRVCLTRPIRP